MADWSKMKAEYIRGGISTRKLAEKYGVSYSTLKKNCITEGWVNLRKQKESKATARIVDACATKEAEQTCKAYEAADLAINRIMKMLESKEIGSKDLKALTSALRDCAAVKGLQTDAERREQEARIAKLHREAEREQETEDAEFKFQIVGLGEEDLEDIVG